MWMGSWGKHMRAESFRVVKEYQKVCSAQVSNSRTDCAMLCYNYKQLSAT